MRQRVSNAKRLSQAGGREHVGQSLVSERCAAGTRLSPARAGVSSPVCTFRTAHLKGGQQEKPAGAGGLQAGAARRARRQQDHQAVPAARGRGGGLLVGGRLVDGERLARLSGLCLKPWNGDPVHQAWVLPTGWDGGGREPKPLITYVPWLPAFVWSTIMEGSIDLLAAFRYFPWPS